MDELLIPFLKYKRFEDERFSFLIYPNVNKYRYVISNYGKLYNFINEKEKKTHYDKDGYIMTSIVFEDNTTKKSKIVGMYRLVAYTFCKKIKNKNIVNHIDGNKKNNYYKNLEWVTPCENTRHAIRTGLQCNSGPNCPSAIYSEYTVRKICKFLEDGLSVFEIYSELSGDKKITDRAFYMLIFSIKDKKRHVSISKEYNIPKNVKSIKKPKFSKKENELITNMIKEGYKTMDIVKKFGGNSCHDEIGKRICDKVRYTRKILSK